MFAKCLYGALLQKVEVLYGTSILKFLNLYIIFILPDSIQLQLVILKQISR